LSCCWRAASCRRWIFIVNVTLSSIHQNLHAAPAELQLEVLDDACGYGVFLITGGRLGDLNGRRLCFWPA
jgi:hypothetical protein